MPMADELVDLERDPQGEPVFALPGRAIALGLIVGAVACGVVGVVAAELIPAAIGMQVLPGTWVAAILGVGAASIGNALGLLVLWPSARRPASTWTSVWMAASGLRLMATGGLAALLYFRSPGEPRAFVLVTGFTYLVLLVVETAVIAKVLGPALGRLPSQGTGANRNPKTPP
jgi:hypothetical protein